MYKSRFKSINKYMKEVDGFDNSPENSEDSPCSVVSNDGKITSTSKKRRGVQKKVVLIPIKDVEGFRVKGDHMSAPPSDSWAWRKYGQKPIKGSPYPRGYYRCSSSKGCPARKQVERSKLDPTMLTVTYACEHNHPLPASRNNHHTTRTTATAAAPVTTSSFSDEEEELDEEIEEVEEEDNNKPIVNTPTMQFQEPILEYKFHNLPLINASEFGWLTDFESTIESPILAEVCTNTDELGMVFTMREEDEQLFADLGELPECSTVFRRGMVGREAEQGRRELATTS